MNKKISNIQEIKENIKESDLFELRFNKECSELTESINSISFSDKKSRIYFTITNFGQTMKLDPQGKLKVFNYNLNLDNLDIIIHDGMSLLLYNRNNDLQYTFDFVGCVLEDIAEQKLDYNLDNKFKTYIITISYYHIFKN